MLTTSGLLQVTSASLFPRVAYQLPLAVNPSCTSSLQEHLQAMLPHQTLNLSLQDRAPGNTSSTVMWQRGNTLPSQCALIAMHSSTYQIDCQLDTDFDVVERRVFRKGGVMTALGEYIAEVNTLSVTPRHMNAQPSSHKLGPQIATSNVGYQLLQKAGWAEGQGLGRNQQGRPIPLGAYHQQARQGIGVGTTQPGHPQHSLDSTSKRGRASAGDDKAKKPQQKQQLPVPHVPEDPQVKRQRHQQVSQLQALFDTLHISPSMHILPCMLFSPQCRLTQVCTRRSACMTCLQLPRTCRLCG